MLQNSHHRVKLSRVMSVAGLKKQLVELKKSSPRIIKQCFELRNDVMTEKKIWFKGINRRLWIPVSIEGWGITALFFIGLSLMKKMNNFSPDVSLTITQIFTIVVEFAVLLGILYFVTKGHVDKKY